jgi:hypothetical protein
VEEEQTRLIRNSIVFSHASHIAFEPMPSLMPAAERAATEIHASQALDRVHAISENRDVPFDQGAMTLRPSHVFRFRVFQEYPARRRCAYAMYLVRRTTEHRTSSQLD